jgi:hypothetical protein
MLTHALAQGDFWRVRGSARHAALVSQARFASPLIKRLWSERQRQGSRLRRKLRCGSDWPIRCSRRFLQALRVSAEAGSAFSWRQWRGSRSRSLKIGHSAFAFLKPHPHHLRNAAGIVTPTAATKSSRRDSWPHWHSPLAPIFGRERDVHAPVQNAGRFGRTPEPSAHARMMLSSPMDRAMLENTLAAAERHLAEAERQVAIQREHVTQLERDGCDTAMDRFAISEGEFWWG